MSNLTNGMRIYLYIWGGGGGKFKLNVTLLRFTGFTYEMCVSMQYVANKNCTPAKAVWQIKQQCFWGPA